MKISNKSELVNLITNTTDKELKETFTDINKVIIDFGLNQQKMQQSAKAMTTLPYWEEYATDEELKKLEYRIFKMPDMLDTLTMLDINKNY